MKRWLLGAVALVVLALAAVGARGVYRWLRPAPASARPPELARPVERLGPGDRSVDWRRASVPTLVADLAPEQVAELERRHGRDLAPELPAGGWTDGALAAAWPQVLVVAEVGPGPAGDRAEVVCYVPCEGCRAEVSVAWGEPERAGLDLCAASAARDTAQEAARVAEEVARRLEAEARLSLRGGPGYGTGGLGLLLLASGAAKLGPVALHLDGVAWLPQDLESFAVAGAATVGLDKVARRRQRRQVAPGPVSGVGGRL